MKHKGNPRMILLDLLVPILILVGVGGILLIEQRGYTSAYGGGYNSTYIGSDEWEVISAKTRKPVVGARKAWLVYGSMDPESNEIKNEIAYVLKTLGVDTDTYAIHVSESDVKPPLADMLPHMPEGCTDLILCLPSLASAGIAPEPIMNWVESGGNIVFAGGLEEGEAPAPWNELLGVKNADEAVNTRAESMRLVSQLLAGGMDMEFSDEVLSCDILGVLLDEKCVIHATTADELAYPLLWERQYGDGLVLVCNADLMDSKADRGIIAACYCRLCPAYVYPVINSAVYCIDDFPSVAPAGYDQNILSQYGYTINDFYANVWWPSMHNIAVQNDIVYSTFLIQCYSDDVDGPFNNTDSKPSAKYYARLLMEDGCEIGLHGYNHQPLVLDGYEFDEKNSGYQTWHSVDKMIEATKTAIAYAQSLSPEIEIQAYVAPSNVISQDTIEALTANIDSLRILAGIYIGTPDQMVQEFEALDDGIVNVPRLTADMQMEDSEWWLQLNELNYHFVESNFIHPDDILDEDRSDGGDFKSMLEGYQRMVAWNRKQGLRARTISEAAGDVQRYCNLSITQKNEADRMSIHVDGLIDKAFLMLRTRDNIPGTVEGGAVTEIDKGCYLLEVDSEDVTILWEEK